MRVLVVSPVPVDPVTAGNRARIATMTGLFVKWGWDVHYAFIPMEPADLPAHISRFGADRFHLLSYRQPMPSWSVRAARKAARLFKMDAGHLWALDAWYDEQLTAQLQALHREHDFDLVCVEYVFMSKALEAFGPDVIKILDTHDCFADRHRRYLQHGQAPQWFSTTEEAETDGFTRAHAVLAIQPQEAVAFSERVGRRKTQDCTVLEFGHITPEVPQIQCSRDPVGIFLGSDNPINVAALNWFVSAVMPVLQRQVPGFKLKVVGSACNAIGDMNGVDKLGFVDDLAEAFSQACVNINPVFMGTGVNIKLLDAMMHGMPCICSATGARGLEQYAGEGVCIVADGDAQGFANAVIEHLNDPVLRAKSANEARAAALNWNRRQQESLSSWVAHVRSRRI